MRDDATDSERSRIEANGAMSAPISASKRAISVDAEVASIRPSVDSGTSGRSAIGGTTAAW
jgi:hypothetical protein